MNTTRLRFSFVVGLAIGIAVTVYPNEPAAATTCAAGQQTVTVFVRNPSGTLLSNIRVALYRQGTNADGQPFLDGSAILSGVTDRGGAWVSCVAASTGPYALNVYQYASSLGNQIFWNTSFTTTPTDISAEVRLGELHVIVRNGSGDVLKGSVFDLYVQRLDVRGQPIVDRTTLLRRNVTTGNAGEAVFRVGSGQYLLRTKSAIAGQALTFSDFRVSAGQSTIADVRLSTLRVRVIDGLGRPQAKFRFQVYTQYDRGNHILPARPILSSSTTSNGRRDIVLPPGTYAVISATRGTTAVRVWDMTVPGTGQVEATIRLSGLRVQIRDSVGVSNENAVFGLARQRIVNGKPEIDTWVARSRRIGKTGFRDFLLTPADYVFVSGARRVFFVTVSEGQFTRLDFPRSLTLRPADDTTVVTPLLNPNVTFRATNVPSTRRLPRFQRALSRAYRLRADQFNRPIQIIFHYPLATFRHEGLNATKIRIAAYDEQTRRWRYLGRYDRRRGQVAAYVQKAGVYILALES